MPEKTDEIQHRMKLTDNTSIPCMPYPLPYAMREELRNEVDSMLEIGVVRPSTSSYASPIVMVKKKDGSNKVFAEHRKLNKTTEGDPEPTTMAEDLFRQLSGKKYLSKFDLTRGCVQNSPDGQYEFLWMPFGMVNSGATLVQGIKKVLEGLSVTSMI